MIPSDPCVVGVDIGGTSTRAVLASRSQILATAVGRGSNPISLGYDIALATWAEVIRTAIATFVDVYGIDPVVEHCMVGGAGASSYPLESARAYARLQAASGSRRTPTLSSDVSVAFASATSSPEGLVIVAGTGAVAARVRGPEVLEFVDGNGWLVGDAGSGHWIGVEAARSVLASYQNGPSTLLRQLVVDNASLENSWNAVTRWIYDLPPRGLARLAPLVSAAAADQDPVAEDILDRAADELIASLARLAPVSTDGPIVLAGSIAKSPGVLLSRLESEILARWGLSAIPAGEGAVGAARLAWREVDRDSGLLRDSRVSDGLCKGFCF